MAAFKQASWSIRTWLSLLALALILPFAGVLCLCIYNSARNEARQARENAVALAHLTATHLDEKLSRSQEVLSQFADGSGVRAMDPNLRPGIFDRVIAQYPQFQNLFLVYRDGRLVHSALPQASTPKISFAEARWFQQLKETRMFTVGWLFEDPINGRRVSILACPVFTEAGVFRGGLCATIDLHNFQNVLTNSSLPEGSLIAILDGQGMVLACSLEPERLMGSNRHGRAQSQVLLPQPEGETTATEPDGVARLYGFTAMSHADWRVVVGVPKAAAFAPVVKNAFRSSLLALALIGLTVILALWLSGRINRSVRALAQALQQAGEGQWEIRVPEQGPREVIELARAFNLMATSRQQVEERLRAAEAKYRPLVEQALAGVYIIQDGRVVYANPRLEEIFGYQPGESLKLESVMEVVAPESRPAVEANIRRRLAGEIESVQYLFVGLRQDGTRIDVEAFGSLAEWEGRPAILGLLLDITERKRAQEALRRSEAKYRTLIEQSVDGIFLVDQDGRFVGTNPAGCLIPGLSKDEIIGRHVSDLIAPEELPRVPATMARIFAGETICSEWSCNRSDGSRFMGELRAKMLPDGLILAIMSDISARKRTEEERARLAGIVEATPDFVGSATPEGHIFYLNRAARRVLGLGDQEELGPAQMADFHPPQSHEKLVNVALPAAQRDGTWSGQIVWRARDGREIPTLQVVVAHQAADGSVRYFSTVAHDITKLKRAEQELRDISGRLLHTQEAVQRSIARELHDTTGQNLVALNMNLRALQESVPRTDPAGGKVLEESLQLAHQCTEQLRTFAYLLHPPVLEDLGLQGALRDYAMGFEQRSGIQVECDLAAELGPLPKEAELACFRVAQEGLINIHRHSGSPTAAVRLWQDENEIWLEIADTGRGIPPDKLKATDHATQGLGVGIPGMRERVRQLGGRLEIRSTRHGTTLQAIVPLPARGDDP